MNKIPMSTWFFVLFVVFLTVFIALIWWKGLSLFYALISLYLWYESALFELKQENNTKKR